MRTHARLHKVHVAPPKAFLEVAPLRRGRPDEWKRRYYCVYTRDTRVPLSPHLAWKHSIHKAFRAFLSPPHTPRRAAHTYAHAHTQTHRRGRVHDPLPTTRGLTPVTYSEFRCRAKGWPRPGPR